MLRSTSRTIQRWSQTFDSSVVQHCLSVAGTSLSPTHSHLDTKYPPPFIRPFHSASSISKQAPFNLQPVHSMYSVVTKPQRIGLRFISSDGRGTSNSDSTGNRDSAHEESSTGTPQGSGQSAPGTATSKEDAGNFASERNVIQGLRDSVDTTIKEVRSKVDPTTLLYYFGFVAAFGILVVGPFAARQMQLSDTDYDELDPEDPVADLATFVRAEFLKDMMGESYEEVGSKMGGLDTLLADLLRSPQIQGAVNDLVNSILTSPQFKRSCSVLLKELWKDLVDDPETLQQVIHLLQNAIQDEAIKDAAVQLVTEVFGDQEVLDEVVDLFQRLGNERKVQVATQNLLVESAHNALNDPEILDHSMEFATDVVGDDVVQQTAGEALYNTLSYAVRPTVSIFLAVLGTGLIFVSLMAFQHSLSPESQSESLDRALVTFEKSAAVQRLIQMVTFPWHALLAVKDALVWLVLLPFRALTRTLTSLGLAGNATINALNQCIQWVINLPIRLAQTLTGAMGFVLTKILEGLAYQSQQLGRKLSGSRLGVFFSDLSEWFSAAITNVQVAWFESNRVVGNCALAIEAFGRGTIRVLEKGMTASIAGWVATKSSVVKASVRFRAGWLDLNDSLQNIAFRIEDKLSTIPAIAVKGIGYLQQKAAKVGLTRGSFFTLGIQGKDLILGGYAKADKGALRVGLFLEDVISKASSLITKLRSSTQRSGLS